MDAQSILDNWSSLGSWLPAALVLLALPLWAWTRRRESQRLAREADRFAQLARLLVATPRRQDSFDAEAEGRWGDRRFTLRSSLVMVPGRNYNPWELQVATPLRGLPDTHVVEFKNIPAWAPQALRERPYADRGLPMPDGWHNSEIQRLSKALLQLNDEAGRLSIADGALCWTLAINRSSAGLPDAATLPPRLQLMSELAETLEGQRTARSRAAVGVAGAQGTQP